MALYAINSLLDDLISKQLSKYFATLMDSEDGDEKFSDVRVKDGSIVLNNLFAKPATVNRRLALARLPAKEDAVRRVGADCDPTQSGVDEERAETSLN